MYLVVSSCIPQSPRYDSLRTVLADLLKYYLSNVVKEREDGDGRGREEDRRDMLKKREAMFDEYIMSLPRNKEDYQRLVECGYNERLWTEVCKGSCT